MPSASTKKKSSASVSSSNSPKILVPKIKTKTKLQTNKINKKTTNKKKKFQSLLTQPQQQRNGDNNKKPKSSNSSKTLSSLPKKSSQPNKKQPKVVKRLGKTNNNTEKKKKVPAAVVMLETSSSSLLRSAAKKTKTKTSLLLTQKKKKQSSRSQKNKKSKNVEGENEEGTNKLVQAGISYKLFLEKSREPCCICLDSLLSDVEEGVEEEENNDSGPTERSQAITLPQCQGHPMHLACLEACLYQGSLKCPICSKIYGAPRTGNQPKNGKMTTQIISDKLPGYKCKTIMIDYSFPDGIQDESHPFPGQEYEGTWRTAFLPDNAEGRNVLGLLQLAWKRRLIFQVNYSITRGEDAGICVVWNGIHHKTEFHGEYGFPDATYLSRVTEELASMGVVEEEGV